MGHIIHVLSSTSSTLSNLGPRGTITSAQNMEKYIGRENYQENPLHPKCNTEKIQNNLLYNMQKEQICPFRNDFKKKTISTTR